MKTQARLRLRPPEPRELYMPRVKGYPFRCRCGANVFFKRPASRPAIFVCNACGEAYEGS